MRSLSSFLRKPRPTATLTVSSAAEHQPTSGLLIVEMTLEAPAGPARLRVFLEDAGAPVFEKPLALTGEPYTSWIALHGQMLPEGPSAIRLQVVDDRGGVLAERSMTLQARNAGELAKQVGDSLAARGAPLVLDVCDSGAYDYADPKFTAWFDRAPSGVEAHLKRLATTGAATPEQIEALRHFAEQGYLVVPDAIDPEHLARINAAVDDAVAHKIEGYEWGSSQRIHNLHQQYPAIQDLWLHPKIIRLLELIFETPVLPCQSLTYVFGSQQEHHQDTIHLTPFPAGRMCGVWTALEDVQPDSGELVVFPGSHRLPRVYMRSMGLPKIRNDDWTAFHDVVVSHWTDLINANGLERTLYRPKAGTVLIWHENLMHAGAMRNDASKSRRSIVGHYFAQGAVVYYDSSGLPGVLYQDAAA